MKKTKFLDMPYGSEVPPAMEQLVINAAAGRQIAIVPLQDGETYAYSGEMGPTDNHDLALWRCVKMAVNGTEAAQAEGHATLYDYE